MRTASKTPLFVLLAAMTLLAAQAAAQLPFLVINELDSDTPTSPVNDDKEFIELFDGGIGNQSLAGYTLVFYNGAPGAGAACASGTNNGVASYFAIDLTGSTDASGYYVVGNVAVIPAPAQTFVLNTLQNGADAVGLYFGTPAAMFPNGTPATAVNLVDAVAYDTSDPVACNLIAVLTPGQPSVNENAHAQSANESIGRCPNGLGGPFTTTGWQAGAPSPGSPNNCATNVYEISITQPGGCGGTLTLSVVNAGANAELYNLISLACTAIPGTGPLFGLSVGPGSSDPLQQVFLPLGSHPFHVNADINGNYSVSFPTSPCPGTPFTVQAVSLQVIGSSVAAISQTTTCISVSI